MSGLKKRVEYLIKHSPLIQVLYRKGMSFAFQTLGLFVRRDEKLILLSASGGRKYGDSPRILFEAMKNDPRFDGYKYVLYYSCHSLHYPFYEIGHRRENPASVRAKVFCRITYNNHVICMAFERVTSYLESGLGTFA